MNAAVKMAVAAEDARQDETESRPRAVMATQTRARLRRLTLTDFRSYARLDLALDGRPVAFSGANGAGKTNILEAISMLSPGRGALMNCRASKGRAAGRCRRVLKSAATSDASASAQTPASRIVASAASMNPPRAAPWHSPTSCVSSG